MFKINIVNISRNAKSIEDEYTTIYSVTFQELLRAVVYMLSIMAFLCFIVFISSVLIFIKNNSNTNNEKLLYNICLACIGHKYRGIMDYENIII